MKRSDHPAKMIVQKKLALQRLAAAKISPLKRKSLLDLKRRAMRKSLSSEAVVAGAARPSFGFIPSGAEIEVLSWPKL